MSLANSILLTSLETDRVKQARAVYLAELSEDYGIPLNIVLQYANLLGPSEDYDGLVTELEDLSLSDKYL